MMSNSSEGVMTRFNRHEHWDALNTCLDATDFGANVDDSDIVTLNDVAGSYAANDPARTSRAQFNAALSRVRAAVEARKVADPERAASVIAERERAARERREIENAEERARKERARLEQEAEDRESVFHRRASLIAFSLGLRNRDGFQYLSKRKAEKFGFDCWMP
jgi:hypothetical protein